MGNNIDIIFYIDGQLKDSKKNDSLSNGDDYEILIIKEKIQDSYFHFIIINSMADFICVCVFDTKIFQLVMIDDDDNDEVFFVCLFVC